MTYELRECGRCFEGRAYESSVPTGRWVPCSACHGSGRTKVFVYARKKKERSR